MYWVQNVDIYISQILTLNHIKMISMLYCLLIAIAFPLVYKEYQW